MYFVSLSAIRYLFQYGTRYELTESLLSRRRNGNKFAF